MDVCYGSMVIVKILRMQLKYAEFTFSCNVIFQYVFNDTWNTHEI